VQSQSPLLHGLEISVDCIVGIFICFANTCRSKDDELTQLKVLAAEKDLALQTLQARTQELLERCGKQDEKPAPIDHISFDLHPVLCQLLAAVRSMDAMLRLWRHYLATDVVVLTAACTWTHL
jgi:hypothetical protein